MTARNVATTRRQFPVRRTLPRVRPAQAAPAPLTSRAPGVAAAWALAGSWRRVAEAAVAAAGDRAERNRALAEVAAALSGAVSVADVVRVILREGQAALGASGSGLAVREGDRVRYLELNGYTADVKAAWAEFPMSTSSPVTTVLRTGRPVLVECSEDLLARFDNPKMRAFLADSGEQAIARLPLRSAAGVIGVLGFGFARPRRFTAEDVDFLDALAGQCAQALERARLYERARTTARLLQRSLLPAALPDVPGVHLSARYRPAGGDVDVGGDWYDAVRLPDGRLALAVGDVMGKGVRAASVMAQVRNALRGLLYVDPAPDAVLAWLDALVAATGRDEELVTVAYGVFDPATGEFAWSDAGHPPPLLLCGGDALLCDADVALPLGLGGSRPVERVVLGPGDAVVLYTDGLVETRTRPLDEGLSRLREVGAAVAAEHRVPDAEHLMGLLGADVGDLGGDDDVTALVLCRSSAPAPSEPPRTAELLLPARSRSASAARRFVADALDAWGCQYLCDAALLGVSELVTNAVVHAGSPAELHLRWQGARLRVEVRDSDPTPIPHRRPAATTEDTHGRGLLLVDAVADGWGVQDGEDGKVVWFELA